MIYTVSCGMELLILSQTATMQSAKRGPSWAFPTGEVCDIVRPRLQKWMKGKVRYFRITLTSHKRQSVSNAGHSNIYSKACSNWYVRYFLDDIFKCIFLKVYVWISITISLKFVPKGPIINILTLVQIMPRCREGEKPLYEPMMA